MEHCPESGMERPKDAIIESSYLSMSALIIPSFVGT
uniref:Uncharacterized protein n=1 Tax=Setaria italica TaxID=4555 RepID=K4A3M4_SETIT